MTIAKPDKARTKIKEFIGLLIDLQQHDLNIKDMVHADIYPVDITRHDNEADMTRQRIRELRPLIQAISKRISPDSDPNQFEESDWDWIEKAKVASEHLIGDIDLITTYPEILGTAGPTLVAEGLHPWIWNAAVSLWDNGHYKQAVENAWNALVEKTQIKTGSTATGKKLYSNLFTVSSGDNRPLEFSDIKKETENWTSAHEGAHHFGMGCSQGIRNLRAHTTDTLDEQEALEYLASFSVLARWIDKATLREREAS